MPYIEKDKDENIVGVYSIPQNGKDLAWLDGDIEDFVKKSYREKRLEEYTNGDYIDALMKEANVRRMGGEDLPVDLDNAVNHWLGVKKKHPKPKGK